MYKELNMKLLQIIKAYRTYMTLYRVSGLEHYKQAARALLE